MLLHHGLSLWLSHASAVLPSLPMSIFWKFQQAPALEILPRSLPNIVFPNPFAWPHPCLFFVGVGRLSWVFSPWDLLLHTFEQIACTRRLGKNKRYARVHHRKIRASVLIQSIHWIDPMLDLSLFFLLVRSWSLASEYVEPCLMERTARKISSSSHPNFLLPRRMQVQTIFSLLPQVSMGKDSI